MGWEKLIVAGAAAAVAASVAYWKRDEIKDVWESLIISLKGKRVAVLGERNVGKTVLLRFLASGEVPDEYMHPEQTMLTEKVERKRFAMGDLKLDLKETRDVSGGHDAIEEWKALHDEADIVVYLVNAQQVNQQRIRRDLEKLESWSKARAPQPTLVVIVTHMDLDPTYVATPASGLGHFRDRFVKLNLDAGLSKLSHRPPIILGSLVNRDQAAKLVATLIKTVTA
ncbi:MULTISPECIES: GTPase domain-containing protein [unclassified Pseudomonas]|uniref:GTPase domain-containing protein n=1 Tax=unclassified Pseudomonas TaxID=196821 RepID=UPI0008D5AE19|nr:MULTISPECIES: GTPase domain-containing protein [unclassified Pseudomonas]MEA1030629.1 GTPase domain-containing protein [Pseudomonas sp. N-137]SEN65443.1 ADP-ribosylation factor family protein [Pseudomonas sp. NFACC39-1]